MSKSIRLACLSLVVLAAAAITASADDKKETTKKGQLPTNWGKIGLSDEQRSKVYTIQSEFKEKIDGLRKQLADLQKQERAALEAVLTDGQKIRLKEIALEKVPGAGKADKKSDDTKKPDGGK